MSSGRMTAAATCTVAVLLCCGSALRGDDAGDLSRPVLTVSDCCDVESVTHCGRNPCSTEMTCYEPIPTCGEWDVNNRCGPRWTVSADALFLDRRRPASAELIFNQVDASQNLNAADFQFDVTAGVDVAAVWYANDRYGVELRCFGIDPSSSRVNVATTLGDPLQVNTALPLITAAGDSITAYDRSDLLNWEINGRYRIAEGLAVLAGFRYLEIDERFEAELPGAAIPFDYEALTRNRLYGAQIGGDAILWQGCGPLSVQAEGRAGVYGNSIAQDSMFSTGVATLPAQGRKTFTSLVGEVALTARYTITDRLAIRGGYRLLWVDGVALATDQIAASNFVTSSGINATGDVFYHGAFTGLNYEW